MKKPDFSGWGKKLSQAKSWGQKALGDAHEAALTASTFVAEKSSALEKQMDKVDTATRQSGLDDMLSMTPLGMPIAAGRATARRLVKGTRAVSSAAKNALEADSLTGGLKGALALKKQVEEVRGGSIPTAPMPPPRRR